MIYPFELLVPADTAENALVFVRHFVPPGKIVRIMWVMPTGCNDMVKARFLADETQILPILPDTWMKGNGIMGPFEEDITVAPGGQHFQLVACSPDTVYPHTITLYVDLVEEGARLEDILAAIQTGTNQVRLPQGDILSEGDSIPINQF